MLVSNILKIFAKRRSYKKLLALLAVCGLPTAAQSAMVNVAVAANFTAPMKAIAQGFERDTGHRASLSFGATGQFYAQIRNGAPFDVLLAADEDTAIRIEKEGLGPGASRFTYAIGRLVLWSKRPDLVDDRGAILKSGQFEKIAIANPRLAPYGAAAMDVMRRLDVLAQITPKIVEGANISQTFLFVSSGNASLGFIALSQVYENGKIRHGSGWLVPPGMHNPIKQDAILLNPGRTNPAAIALLDYLRSDNAKSIMRSFGYAQ